MKFDSNPEKAKKKLSFVWEDFPNHPIFITRVWGNASSIRVDRKIGIRYNNYQIYPEAYTGIKNIWLLFGIINSFYLSDLKVSTRCLLLAWLKEITGYIWKKQIRNSLQNIV